MSQPRRDCRKSRLIGNHLREITWNVSNLPPLRAEESLCDSEDDNSVRIVIVLRFKSELKPWIFALNEGDCVLAAVLNTGNINSAK